MMELRCASKKHGEVIIPGEAVVEFSCDSRFCGKRPGVVVLHRFDVMSGKLVDTHRYNTQIRSK